MSDHAIDLARLADLRSRASRLTGATTTQGAAARSADALAVLHALASSPQTAPDALALLHELQVHQIELDLQAEELRESRFELESALRRQIELYDFQPVGCFTIDRGLVMRELNRTGAAMLGLEPDEAHGTSLDTFLTAESRRTLKELVSSAVEGEKRAPCQLMLCPRQGPERRVQAHVGTEPGAHRYFVVLADAGDAHELQPRAR